MRSTSMKKGVVVYSRSMIFDGKAYQINSKINFDSNGKIIQNESSYLNMEYLNNRKILKVELPNFLNDSINVYICKTLNGFQDFGINGPQNKLLRSIHFENISNSTIQIDIKKEDFYRGKMNLLIRG